MKLTPLEVMQSGPVIPVLVINDIEDALPVAFALAEGGVKVLEVTLRTPAALDVIELISKNLPDVIVGAGTVLNTRQFEASQKAGAQFIISPGLTDSLISCAKDSGIAFLPGVSTISDMMRGLDAGINEFKFFPAEANGGVKALQAIGGPFPDVNFCPTGGITMDNAKSYLALNNVVCVGGSWLVTKDILSNKDYSKITEIALDTTTRMTSGC